MVLARMGYASTNAIWGTGNSFSIGSNGSEPLETKVDCHWAIGTH